MSLLTIALFSVTLLLFRSFSAHRIELGKRWSVRGAEALRAGQAEQSVEAMRTALSYAPGQRAYELVLAQALAEAGHTEEASNYFSGLWETEPGNGFINLQLARLAGKRHDPAQAVNYYRAAIYGTWEGDGVVRRREVRLELAEYLLGTHDVPAARAELLVAEGNADNDPALDGRLGRLFERAGDTPDAYEAYMKATVKDPKDGVDFASAGQLAYAMGHYSDAKHLLQEGLRMSPPDAGSRGGERAGASDLLARTDRLLDLLPSRKLRPTERVDRLLELRELARKRLETCTAHFDQVNVPLQDLAQRWSTRARLDTRRSLLQDPLRQDDLLQLVYETELTSEKVCGPAAGDDSIVVQLARDPGAVDR